MNGKEGFGKQNPLHNFVAVSDNTCVAARIRPVCTYKKRKLVRATSVSHFSRKPLKPLTVKCSCEWPNSCILCSCEAPVQTIDPDTMSLEERIALLDSGFHPILSLSHGNPLHLHFETLLREDGLQRLLSRELKTLKMSHFGQKQDPTNSAFPKLRSSLLLASRSLFEGRRQPEGPSSHSFPVCSPWAHKYGSLHLLSLCPKPPPAPSASQVPFTGSSAMSSKRRKAERSYDIDNIVIPMSMAATARVEKPEYKEVVVPSWRIEELEELPPFNQADSELEDTSDEMYSSHHSKYEDLERARWDSWAAATSHKRGSRTRTVLSCSEGTRSSLEMLDEAMQNVQPWEPRTFPLSDSLHQGLLQCTSEGGYEQADSQPHVSSNVIPSVAGMQFSGTHLQTDSNKSTEEFVVQHCNPGKLVNDDTPELWCV